MRWSIKEYFMSKIKIAMVLFFIIIWCQIITAQDETNVGVIATNEKYIINFENVDKGYLAPIGWSRNGYFAYAMIMDYSNGRGSYISYSVEIINVITDHYIVDFTVNSMDDTIGTFEEFWIKNKEKITSILEENDIISFPNIGLQNMNTLWEQHGLEVQYDDNAENEMYTDVIIQNNKGQRKIVASLYSLYTNTWALGYYKSPFENRIVFFMKKKYLGGPEQGEEYYSFIGCHTTVGFR
jgi:hypothetical protein